MSGSPLRQQEGGVLLAVKVVPGSSRTAVAGALGDMLKIKVAAAPEKGKANDCLIAFLSKRTGVRKQDIEIVAGHTNPLKQVWISGVNVDTIASALGL